MSEVRSGDEASLGQLFSGLTSDLSELLRKEIELAKVELKQEAARATKVGGLFGASGMAGYMALVLFSFAAAWALAVVLPRGGAFAIIAAVYAVVGTVCFLAGRQRARQVRPVPEQTVETLKEDAQWAKTRTR